MAGVGVFLVCLLIGVPIAFAMIAMTLVLIPTVSDPVLFRAFHQQLFGGLENYGLLALPLFLLVGELMSEGGIARRLIALARLLVGRLSGGLAYVNLIANAMMASILGSAIAQISMMNRVITPEMEKAGYNKEFSVSLSTGAGLLAPVLPPSMVFVVYGVLAQISIGDLFLSGIGPGLVMLMGFLGIILIAGLRGAFKEADKTQQNMSAQESSDLRKLAFSALPAALVPVIILTSIVFGIATPTEAAALAALVSLGIGTFVYKELTLASLWDCLKRAAMASGVILFLIASAQIFGFVIVFEQFPATLSDWITSTATSPLAFLLLVNVLLLMAGMFLDGIAALIIIVPLLLPIATRQFGIDPFQFGVIVCLNLAIGLITPPVGAGLFVASSASGVSPERIAWRVLPFIAVTLFTIFLVAILPALTSFLL
ncbi:MAG: C4-dicarboxylate ABC transporter permease [Ponticaulis sp.]|nr:C4-dicarboxylate ABC transporter permease [Ponticaulis sp.]